MNDNNPVIGMLLDIEHLHGKHEGRLGPLVLSLTLCAMPVFLYIYYQLFTRIPTPLFVIVWMIFAARVIMKIQGREKHRVNAYKKTLKDEYTSTEDLLNIKTIHPDGCIEYRNGKICYLVCCFNGTCENSIRQSVQLRKLLDSMIGRYEHDTYLQNVTDSPALRAYYEKVSKFNHNISARNFINMIDHNLDLVEDTSLVMCTVYAIKGYQSDWKNIRNQIDMALGSHVARVYKSVYRVDNSEDANLVLNKDIDTVVDIDELLRRKYTDHQYGTSKVLAYDLPKDQILIQGQQAQVRVVDDSMSGAGFHKELEE